MKVIVFAHNFPSPSAPANGMFVLNQLKALREKGHSMLVLRIVPYAPPLLSKWHKYRAVPHTYDCEGFSVRPLRAILGPNNLGLGSLRAQLGHKIRREIALFGPDMIHAHTVLPSAYVSVGWGVPVVTTAHGSDTYDLPWRNGSLRRAASMAVRSSDVVVAVSEFVGRAAVSLGASHVPVIYNGADENVFAPGDRIAARAVLDIETDRPVIAFAGDLVRRKGVFELAAAAVQLKDLRPLLLMAGAGDEEEPLRKMLGATGIGARFFGTISQSELARVFAAADVFALPSHREGLPAVICEAMLAGRTVVATNVGGIPEIVKDGETGFIVDKQDAAGLARALRRVVGGERLKTAIESNARDFAIRNLTWRVNATAYDAIYRQMKLK